MSKIVNAEFYKLFSKKGIKLLFLLLIVTSLIVVIISNKYIDSNFKYENVNKLSKEEYDEMFKNGSYEKYEKEYKNYNDYITGRINIHNYLYENKIKENIKIENIINITYTVLTFSSVIVAAIASTLIYSEMVKKSAKELFVMPYKRWKVILSKWIIIIMFSILMYLTIILSMFLFTSIICKSNLFIEDIYFPIKENIYKANYFIYVFKESMPYLISSIFVGTFSMFLSIAGLSSLISSSIVIFSVLLNSLIFQLFLKIKFYFIEYTFLPYLDFGIFRNKIDIFTINSSFNVSLSINQGIIILFIYILLFLILGIIIFSLKDIKN